MESSHLGLVDRAFAFLSNNLFYFLVRLFQYFLDARRVNATISYQTVHGPSCNLATHGIEGRDRNHLWRVIHDNIHTRLLLEDPDVAPAPTYNPSLEVIRGNINIRRSQLSDLLAGQPLNRNRDNLARLAVRLFFGSRFFLSDHARHLLTGFLSNLFQQKCLRFLFREICNSLQIFFASRFHLLQLIPPLVQCTLTLIQALGPLFQPLKPLIKLLTTAMQTSFFVTQPIAPLLKLRLYLLSHFLRLFSRHKHNLMSLFLSSLQQPLFHSFQVAYLLLITPLAYQITNSYANKQSH